MREALLKHKQYLLTGVSYVVPFIACGGILIAISTAGATLMGYGTDTSKVPALKLMAEIGSGAFSIYCAVLAGFIAYGMTNKPGLVPGMLGGYLAHKINAGFLGAIVAGLLAGYMVELIKKLP